jgi:hypothetical protein
VLLSWGGGGTVEVMKPCPDCERHVRLAESVCPFCGACLVEGTAPLGWGWAVGLALLGAACGSEKGDSNTDGATTEALSTTGSSSDGATSTSAPTTSDGTMGGTGTSTSTGVDDPSTTECASCSGSSEGTGFIYASPDMGVTIECDPWVQDCPEGQKCAPTGSGEAWNALSCIPVTVESSETGEPCFVLGHASSGLDNCAKGNVCFNVDPVTLEGMCVAQCTGTPDAPECPPVDTTCTEVAPDLASLCL